VCRSELTGNSKDVQDTCLLAKTWHRLTVYSHDDCHAWLLDVTVSVFARAVRNLGQSMTVASSPPRHEELKAQAE
jgi:hypothetical protein